MNDLLLIAGGLFLLFVGGEALVRGSVEVARKLGLSELVIGLTLVGFGTSMPELVTSLRAIETGAVGIAVGNVAGSNIANVFLVLGVAALIRPILTHPAALARDTVVMVAATAVFALLVYTDQFTRLTGGLMVAALLAYVVVSIILDRGGQTAPGAMHAEEGELMSGELGLVTGLLLAIGGVVAVVFGARFLVDGGSGLATDLGISEAVIGLTVVAVGTSLPELATSVVAAMRGKQDVAVGNVIGSNIFNLFGILGVTAIVSPFSVADDAGTAVGTTDWSAVLDTSVGGSMLSWGDIGMLVLSVILLILFALTGKRVARWEGAVLLAAYVSYMAYLFGAMG